MRLILIFLLFHNSTPSKDTTISNPPYFISMQYKGLSNCIYKVFVTDSLIMGAKVNGYIAAEPNFGMGTTIPKNVMHDPEAYVNKQMAVKYTELVSDNREFLTADKSNFIIRKKDILSITYNPEKKWGMGYYPHNGRIIIETIKTRDNNSAEREFILVGDQNPEGLLNMLKTK